MKNTTLLVFFFIFISFSSCTTASYTFATGQRTGVDFTSGKWLLNELDCPNGSKDKLTEECLKYFKKYTGDRLSYIHDVKGLLVPRKINLNPGKTKLKELKDGTGFDFFINISTQKNKSDFSSLELYQQANDAGKNEASVIVEIYDLNLQQIIYSQNVIGTTSKVNAPSDHNTQSSGKLKDNIMLYKNANQLIEGALKRIFKDLDKRSVK
ncbi:hypothetical protein [Flavobacterium piscisymbiosum]|uniref:Lipoprotein n=1 Tax=Flavobacterium piscisymbiosum TaxID=2893753 RepID=A0ABS8MCS8_9FLAO|nr:hypothetical protein [Flavobacterium sp. F-30]MCC9063297.1 hypothetical protein [Flavobacterium sp. F-30]